MKQSLDSHIKRIFLVNEIPEYILNTVTPKRIRQGFLTQDGEQDIRIVDYAGKYSLQIKSSDGFEKNEVVISKSQFEELWPSTKGRRVQKKRYLITEDGKQLALDVFTKELRTLVLLQADFDDAVESDNFHVPDFVDHEVTHDVNFKAFNMATIGLPMEGHAIMQLLENITKLRLM